MERELDLIALLSQGAMWHTVLQAAVRGVDVDAKVITRHLRRAVTALHPQLQSVVADGLGRIPPEMIAETINVYCERAAMDALRAAGYVVGQSQG